VLSIHDPQLDYEIRRPLLGYPSLVYRISQRRAGSARRPQALNKGRELGLPDPDVVALEIEVAVVDPALGEEVAYRTLYATTREFPAGGTSPLASATLSRTKPT
jgi:hypothetical protein